MSDSCPNCDPTRTPIAQLSDDETKKIFGLLSNAQRAPAIKLSSDPNEKDFATQAWDAVTRMQIEMGKKYGYDHTKAVIMEHGFIYRMTEEELNEHG